MLRNGPRGRYARAGAGGGSSQSAAHRLGRGSRPGPLAWVQRVLPAGAADSACREVAQLVAHLLWEQEVGGSSPPFPTRCPPATGRGRTGMTRVTVSVESAREAFARGAWRERVPLFRESGTSSVHDLERLAIVSYLVGEDVESAKAWEAAHYARSSMPANRGDAARCAAWLGMTRILNGETAQGGGWLARADRRPRGDRPRLRRARLPARPGFLDVARKRRRGRRRRAGDQIVTIARGCGRPRPARVRRPLSRARRRSRSAIRTRACGCWMRLMVSVTAGRCRRFPRASCTAR